MGHGYKEDDFVVDSSSEEEFISEGEESYQVSSNDGSGSDGSHVASRTRTTDRKPPSMPLEKQKYRARYLKKKYDCGESSSEDEEFFTPRKRRLSSKKSKITASDAEQPKEMESDSENDVKIVTPPNHSSNRRKVIEIAEEQPYDADSDSEDDVKIVTPSNHSLKRRKVIESDEQPSDADSDSEDDVNVVTPPNRSSNRRKVIEIDEQPSDADSDSEDDVKIVAPPNHSLKRRKVIEIDKEQPSDADSDFEYDVNIVTPPSSKRCRVIEIDEQPSDADSDSEDDVKIVTPPNHLSKRRNIIEQLSEKRSINEDKEDNSSQEDSDSDEEKCGPYDLWCSICRVHKHKDNFSAKQRKEEVDHFRYCLLHTSGPQDHYIDRLKARGKQNLDGSDGSEAEEEIVHVDDSPRTGLRFGIWYRGHRGGGSNTGSSYRSVVSGDGKTREGRSRLEQVTAKLEEAITAEGVSTSGEDGDGLLEDLCNTDSDESTHEEEEEEVDEERDINSVASHKSCSEDESEEESASDDDEIVCAQTSSSRHLQSVILDDDDDEVDNRDTRNSAVFDDETAGPLWVRN